MRKAQRLNRNMMFAIMAMGVIVIALVFGMLYYSMQSPSNADGQQTAGGDSIIFIQQDTDTLTSAD